MPEAALWKKRHFNPGTDLETGVITFTADKPDTYFIEYDAAFALWGATDQLGGQPASLEGRVRLGVRERDAVAGEAVLREPGEDVVVEHLVAGRLGVVADAHGHGGAPS